MLPGSAYHSPHDRGKAVLYNTVLGTLLLLGTCSAPGAASIGGAVVVGDTVGDVTAGE